jgi:hypothetical protein
VTNPPLTGYTDTMKYDEHEFCDDCGKPTNPDTKSAISELELDITSANKGESAVLCAMCMKFYMWECGYQSAKRDAELTYKPEIEDLLNKLDARRNDYLELKAQFGIFKNKVNQEQ